MFNNLINNSSKQQKIIFISVVQVFLIIILVTIINCMNPEQGSKITLDNFQTITTNYNIPQKTIEEMKRSLFYNLSMKYSKITDESLDFAVREDSIQYIKMDDDVSKINFLVDIDSLEETFGVILTWSKSGESYYDTEPDAVRAEVSCPKKSDMKYPETFCKTALNSTDSIELYVPYSGDDFNISRDNGYTKTINLNIKSCSKRSKSEIRKEAWEYINSTGIDQDEYEFVEKEYCNES